MARHKTNPDIPGDIPSVTPSQRSNKTHQRIGKAKAYALLAEQPASLAGLEPSVRARVVVSAVRDDNGDVVVLSRVGDMMWELWPYVDTPNTSDAHKRFDWSGIPDVYREAIQNVIYAYWKSGRRGWSLPGVSRLLGTLDRLKIFCRHAALLGLSSIAELHPLHVTSFVHGQKERAKRPGELKQIFQAVELLYLFRAEHNGTLQFHPWPESSATEMAGCAGLSGKDALKVGLTPLIPAEEARALYLHAESILNRAEALLDARDRGKRPALKVPEIIVIRNACFYLIGVLTGMRSGEISAIELGAGRIEVKNGITFHWLTSTEYKTKKGKVDYLMPSIGHHILHIMERWSEPYRTRLREQIVAMEQKPVKHTAKELQWLATARRNQSRLFLGVGSSGIRPTSVAAWSVILKQLAHDAGIDWKLAPHQMRRLYAYTFVRHKLGDLLFLKEQFKHSSINMSQLYAASPRQDMALYDDILTELMQYKAEQITNWLEEDEPLAGGASRKIMELRAHDFKDHKALITETSKRLVIRSTGHGWCLAQDEGCGGSGLYERGRCGGCHNGLIDRRFIPIWLEAYQHHKELLADAEELGPGAVKRVKEDLAQATRILTDLGVDPEQGGE